MFCPKLTSIKYIVPYVTLWICSWNRYYKNLQKVQRMGKCYWKLASILYILTLGWYLTVCFIVEFITAWVFPPEKQCKCWWPLLGLFLRNDSIENYDAIDWYKSYLVRLCWQLWWCFARSMYTNTKQKNTNTNTNSNTNTMRVACFCKVWSASHVHEGGAAGEHCMPLVSVIIRFCPLAMF